MDQPLHAFDFLDHPSKYPPAAVTIALGDERFLRSMVVRQLRTDDDSLLVFSGSSVTWQDIGDALSARSLFGTEERRVLLQDADPFVRDYRTQLESYVERPAAGTLILELDSLPSNTRLYKAVLKAGLIILCRLPETKRGRSSSLDRGRLLKWIDQWAVKQHRLKLAPGVSQQLLEMVGEELGLLDRELAKLALFVSPGETADAELVQRVVGGWRTKTSWEMLDAAASGRAAEALRLLDRLLQAGEHPQALFGPISWSLRRFAKAARLAEQVQERGGRIDLRQILVQAGFHPYQRQALERGEQQIRQIGRQRASQLYRWLLETDLALKGSHSAPDRARFALEMLILRLSEGARPATRDPAAR